MLSIGKRISFALHGENGASSLEYVVIISIVIVLCSVLAVFGDNIQSFMGNGVKHASHIGWRN